ncbi:50S ribosomal protein L6 [Sedimenticola hydrogenitrophicus]|uniref:50S ribosomal protein L6 n=1 Tax=Sedimenticola hydrogenitrophicus TaxID=2967975 RepID=UPI0023B050E7|nr:50S ribosomal protein L6 [Sedimenticola hydrogenitrophicus]
MSRVAKNPIPLPSGVDVNLNGSELTVKGSKGTMTLGLHAFVTIKNEGDTLRVVPVQEGRNEWAMAGTFRALVGNMVTGVSTGFQKKLQLIGVGYRAQAKGDVLNMNLGFSHPVDYPIPEGITIETPSQTEIVVSGCDKQRVGQVSAEIRAYRPPEPYKGKGVRYADEHVARKEAKKK